MGQLFLVSPHLCYCQHKVVGSTYCILYTFKKDTSLPGFIHPACTYFGECGLHSDPHVHLVRCIYPTTICSTLYNGPELSLVRIVKLEKFYFGALLFHTCFLLCCSAPFCCQALPQALTWSIPSSYLLVTLLHSKLPVLFSRLLAFHIFLLTVGDNGASHHL